MSLTIAAAFALKTLAVKAVPIIGAKVGAVLAGSGGVALLAKLAGTPALKAIAVKLATSEAFQAFAIKLATSEVGKTVIVKGIKITVTEEMKEELKKEMKRNPKLAEVISKATGSAMGNVGGRLIDSFN